MSLELLNDIARSSVSSGDICPDPKAAVGRQCFALSDAEDKAISCVKDCVKQLFERNGVPQNCYDIKKDAFGSLFVTFFGRNREKTVVSGSHVDSVKDGGKFDGVAGVQSAYNFLEYLVHSKQIPKYNYCFVAFRAEESSPSDISACLGSGIATGTITVPELLSMKYCRDDIHRTLKDHFISRDGEDGWRNVLQEIQNPPFRPENTELYEELHIEQSSVILQDSKEFGIVVDGIGGARREKYCLSPAKLPMHSVHVTQENPHKRFILKFLGEEAHTAGAPPNPRFSVTGEGATWYRSDALVSAAHFMKHVLSRCLRDGVDVHFENMCVPQERGFTTVTPEQVIQCIVPANQISRFEDILKHYKLLPKFKKTTLSYEDAKDVPPGSFTACDADHVVHFLKVPLFVEELGRRLVHKQGGIGKVRATVTDFIICCSKGVQFKIDYRDIDLKGGDYLQNEVGYFLARIPELSALELLSNVKKPFSKVCEIATETKRRIAKILSLDAYEMPSMPGHDASRFSQAGVKTTMTFVRHPGASHNPKEDMYEKDFEKAQALSHAFLAEVLEVSYSYEK